MQKRTKIILSTICMMGLSILHAENSDNSAAANDALLQQMDEERLAYHGMDAALAVTEDKQLKAIYQRLRTGSEHHLAAFSGNQSGKRQQGWRGNQQKKGNGGVQARGCRDKQGCRCVKPGCRSVQEGNRAINRGCRQGKQGCGNANSGKGKHWRQAAANAGV